MKKIATRDGDGSPRGPAGLRRAQHRSCKKPLLLASEAGAACFHDGAKVPLLLLEQSPPLFTQSRPDSLRTLSTGRDGMRSSIRPTRLSQLSHFRTLPLPRHLAQVSGMHGADLASPGGQGAVTVPVGTRLSDSQGPVDLESSCCCPYYHARSAFMSTKTAFLVQRPPAGRALWSTGPSCSSNESTGRRAWLHGARSGPGVGRGEA